MGKPEFTPLVTDNPQGNYQWLHNMTVVKDKEVYLRDFNGEGDLSLVDYCKRECKSKCDSDIDAGAEEFGEYMDCDCIVSCFYGMAVGHAELREHLKQYEESGLSPVELNNLYKLFDWCEWLEDEDGNWKCSKCDCYWTFTEGGPKENEVNYCPTCGKRIAKNISYQSRGESHE
ncbi:hypothetical protein [Desulfitobacterium sp. AusDCA]|uniref:hypothetical protein n=1 Tax=Desulfitobacterium sp. AusDCA TaxID=3240383 RepID=UPI003DA74EB7